jgi:hypothetical protein
MKKKNTSPERHHQLQSNCVCIVKRKFKQWFYQYHQNEHISLTSIIGNKEKTTYDIEK